LLSQKRGVRNIQRQPRLVLKLLLAWADAHFKRTGRWPRRDDGIVLDAGDEKCSLIDEALRMGRRGMPGGSSLLKLLVEKRGARSLHREPLTMDQIHCWARAHHDRVGNWPVATSGPIPEFLNLTWMAVHMALSKGLRGLTGGSSLAKALAKFKRNRNRT
jgi:hypothetical protein